MIYRLRQALLLAAVLGAVYVLWPRSVVSGQPNPKDKPVPVEYFGAASCSAMACHNFNGERSAPRSEYTIWATEDKHRQAYDVLFNERSVRIMKNLGVKGNVQAHEYVLCLSCHSTNPSWHGNPDNKSLLADGVSCEACHGPSKNYLTEHYKEGFKQLPESEKFSQFGLAQTKNLSERTKVCVACHVGDGKEFDDPKQGKLSREVNHDLIAAGHPRLNFEMAGYHGIYKKHWTDAAELERNKDFYSRIWLIGQLTSAQSAVDLLVSRAEGSIPIGDAHPKKPWPEFAEYACYACHKDLSVDSRQQKTRFAGRFPGAFPYGSWYLASTTPLSSPGSILPEALRKDVDTLINAMQRPAPSAQKVIDIGKRASGQFKTVLDGLAKSKPMTDGEIRDLMRSIIGDALKQSTTDKQLTRIDEMNWDEATQTYLSLAALSQQLSQSGAKDPIAIRPDLLAMKERLKGAFPADFDSPKSYDPLKAPTMKQRLESIRSLLAK